MADEQETEPTPKHKDDRKPVIVVIAASVLVGALIGTGLYLLGSKKPLGQR